jgi:hypothetical protein
METLRIKRDLAKIVWEESYRNILQNLKKEIHGK